jgi:hypothetical protein
VLLFFEDEKKEQVMYYDKFRNNKYSQNGEDGVLAVIVNELQIEPSTSWSVDVGAYDGISYSNIHNLIEKGANAIMIEPSIVGGICEPKFEQLKHLPETFPNVIALNYAVIPSSYTEEEKNQSISYIEDNDSICGKQREERLEGMELDDILKGTNIPEDYDILNIDTDRCDHPIWEDHKKYKPKIVIIEIDSSITPETNNTDKGKEALSSFSYSLSIAEKKGYSLICHTGNMIYVRNDLVDKLSIPKELINSNALFNRSWI